MTTPTAAAPRRRKAPVLLAGVAISLAAALGACSSGSGGSDAGGSGGADSMSAAEPAAPAERGGVAADGAGDTASVARVAVQERAVISVGTVSLSSTDVRASRNEVQRIVDAGRGEITGEETQTDDDGDVSWSRLEVRVPSERFDEAMDDLEEAGRLEDATRSAEDVTTQVIDTDVRIRAQERSLRRIEVLLDRAGSLADVVRVEAELTRRQADLDSLKQLQAHLAEQTSMSTITVHIDEATAKGQRTDRDDEPAGFLAGLRSGWRALATSATALATVAGALLPFAVALGVVLVPLWLLLRRSAGRRPPRLPQAG